MRIATTEAYNLQTVNVRIIDVAGRDVMPVTEYWINNNKETSVNTSYLPKGIYHIFVQGGKWVYTTQFMKSRQ